MRKSLRPWRKTKGVEVALSFALEGRPRGRERALPADRVSQKLLLEIIRRLQDVWEPCRDGYQVWNSRDHQIPPLQPFAVVHQHQADQRSEEHTSELQSLRH